MINSLTGICLVFLCSFGLKCSDPPSKCISFSLAWRFFFSYSVINYCIIFVWFNFLFTLSNYLHVGFPDFLLDIHHCISCCCACFFFSFSLMSEKALYILYITDCSIICSGLLFHFHFLQSFLITACCLSLLSCCFLTLFFFL